MSTTDIVMSWWRGEVLDGVPKGLLYSAESQLRMRGSRCRSSWKTGSAPDVRQVHDQDVPRAGLLEDRKPGHEVGHCRAGDSSGILCGASR